MDRLFAIIVRINSVLFLLVLLGAAGSIAWMALESNRWQRRGGVEVTETESEAEKSPLLNFNRVERVAGTDTQMMHLTTQEKSAKYSSGGHGNETRNILFLNGPDRTAHWLFKDHKSLVMTAEQVPEESASSKERPASALYFEYVSVDSNKDGSLSSDDHLSVGLTKPDGNGFLEVLHDVSRVFSYAMLDQQHLSIVYQTGKVVKHAKVSVPAMKIESDQEIINVPGIR
ncbi:MAG: hypothetical protein IPO35_02085 [Uliginosibacterium sp.]|nr:hypothetical protein [Uliginosibacterium sp.]